MKENNNSISDSKETADILNNEISNHGNLNAIKNHLCATKNYIKDNFTNKVEKTKNLLVNNFFLGLPMSFISQSNNKNTISINLTRREYLIKYTDRKVMAFSLSIFSALIHYLRSKDFTRFKVRWIIPYYIFYSLLICRENLDPFQ